MNYQMHYEKLCERTKERQLTGYFERHHIIPRCLGGTDDADNIVGLTPEEHYVAHQLLVKLYPDHPGLAYAAMQMTKHSLTDKRAGNKLYGWIRRRHSNHCKERIGEKNGSYGRSWYYNPDTLENGMFLEYEVPDGWIKGRYVGKIFTIKKLFRKTPRFKTKIIKWFEKESLIPYYNRHKQGESLRNLSKELEYSHVTLYKKLNEYFGA